VDQDIRGVLSSLLLSMAGERYLGFSPDGGDHSFEVLLLVAVVTLFAALGLRLSSIGKINDGVRKKTRNRFFRGL
jgi:hypothetical protein